MKSIAISILTFCFLVFSDNAHAQKGGSWLFTPAFANVSTPSGSNSGLGCGVNLETFFYGKYIAGGFCCQTAYSKYLDVAGGYLKLMPRLGFGYVNDDHTGFLVGGSYGVFFANNGGDDNTDYYTGGVIKEASYKNHLGTGWGVWFHFSINRKFALDTSVDNGGDFKVTRFGIIMFYFVTLNFANISGPGISGLYVYPGLTLRM